MDDDFDERMKILSFVDELYQVTSDGDAINTIKIDLFDLLEAGEWLSQEISNRSNFGFKDQDDIENFIISLQINYLEHVEFHINSLKCEMKKALKNFPDGD